MRTESENPQPSLWDFSTQEVASLLLSLSLSRLDIDAADRRSRNEERTVVHICCTPLARESNDKIVMRPPRKKLVSLSLSCQISRTSVREEFPRGGRETKKRKEKGRKGTGAYGGADGRATRSTGIRAAPASCHAS